MFAQQNNILKPAPPHRHPGQKGKPKALKFKSLVRSGLAIAGLDVRRAGSWKFKPYVQHIDIDGIKFDFWIADETGVEWYVFDGSTAALTEFEQQRCLVRPGDRVLEIGAHHGFFMLYLSKLVGSHGAIVSVEAHPFNAMIANAQIGLNQSINCRILHAAACDGFKSSVLISDISNAKVVASGGIEVPAVTVDELDRQYGPFTVLKIDVEGYESVVLDGAKNILQRSPLLLLELHCPLLRKFGQTVEDVIGKLPEHYRGTMIPRSNPSMVSEFEPKALPNDIVNLFLCVPHGSRPGLT